jgi:hypothetical protein
MLKGNFSKKSTAEADFGNFRIEFLCKFEATCETALALESAFAEKNDFGRMKKIKMVWM